MVLLKGGPNRARGIGGLTIKGGPSRARGIGGLTKGWS